MEWHYRVSSGSKQFPFQILLRYLSHIPTLGLHISVSFPERSNAVKGRRVWVSLSLLLDGRCLPRVGCIWSPYGSSSLNSDRPFPLLQPSEWPLLLVASHYTRWMCVMTACWGTTLPWVFIHTKAHNLGQKWLFFQISTQPCWQNLNYTSVQKSVPVDLTA